jgi:hypothetical protein
MVLPKPCLTCGNLTTGRGRCEPCRLAEGRRADGMRPKRQHYGGKYQAEAKRVRDGARTCWLCGQGRRDADPWQADHVVPGQVGSPLLPAHRSCNIARSSQEKKSQKSK